MLFLRVELLAILSGLFALIAFGLLSGRINLSGLLDQSDPTTHYRTFSPERAQLLVMTLLSAGYVLLCVMSDPLRLPEVPHALLWAQGGSGSAYLGGKAIRIYQSLVR